MIRKTVELDAASTQGIEGAVELALARAAVTLEGIQEVEVVHIRARVEDQRVADWNVKVKVTFQLRDSAHD